MKARVAFALVAGLALCGCGQDSRTVQGLSTGCASTAPGVTVVEAAVREGRAEPAPHRVEVPAGRAVQLRVASDRPAEVHVHGYDVAWQAGPEAPACVSFVADRAGLFDVEAHPEVLLVQIEVRTAR